MASPDDRREAGLKRAGTGRPPVVAEVEQAVIRLAKENPTWGQMRNRGELLKLEITLGARTIAAILNRHGLKPAPERGTDSTWKFFLAEHLNTMRSASGLCLPRTAPRRGRRPRNFCCKCLRILLPDDHHHGALTVTATRSALTVLDSGEVSPSAGKVVRIPRVDGLINHYERVA